MTDNPAKDDYMGDFYKEAGKYSPMKRDQFDPHANERDNHQPAPRPFPVMDDAAYIGLPGDIVTMIKPHTEGTPQDGDRASYEKAL